MLSVPEHEFGVFFSGEGDEEKDTVTLLVVFFPVVFKATLLKPLSEVQNTRKNPGREINR